VDDTKIAGDIMLLIIADEVYDWSNWYNLPYQEQLKLQNFRKAIIRNNPNLVEPISKTNNFYKNVNLPQTLYTWQKVYDTVNVQTIDSNINGTHPVILPNAIYDNPFTTPIIP
jgi:hypothetical protein